MTQKVKRMTSTVLQVRMEDSLRAAAADIAEQLGLDLPTAIRMFLKKMVAERAVPFSLNLPRDPQPQYAALAAMRELGQQAQAAGIADMTLDEINAEIAAARG